MKLSELHINSKNPRTSKNDRFNKLPYINKEPGEYKITLNSGEIFYAHDVKEKYDYNEYILVLKNMSKYVGNTVSAATINPEMDAYSVLMWHLFPDYLNKNKYKDKKQKYKHLYIMRNTNGFIKIGVSNNPKMRIYDLKLEFEGDFEIVKVYRNKGYLENEIHKILSKYKYCVYNKKRKRYSRECFEDRSEVTELCMEMCEN